MPYYKSWIEVGCLSGVNVKKLLFTGGAKFGIDVEIIKEEGCLVRTTYFKASGPFSKLRDFQEWLENQQK